MRCNLSARSSALNTAPSTRIERSKCDEEKQFVKVHADAPSEGGILNVLELCRTSAKILSALLYFLRLPPRFHHLQKQSTSQPLRVPGNLRALRMMQHQAFAAVHQNVVSITIHRQPLIWHEANIVHFAYLVAPTHVLPAVHRGSEGPWLSLHRTKSPFLSSSSSP